jgi:hypothetical protein
LGERRELAETVVFMFTTGEIWTIDTYLLDTTAQIIPPVEQDFWRTMSAYGGFLFEKLGIKPPFKWIAGMEGIRGRGLYIPPRPGHMSDQPSPRGKCQLDVLTGEGLYSPGDSPAECLKLFFTELYDSCGVPRPEWLDN